MRRSVTQSVGQQTWCREALINHTERRLVTLLADQPPIAEIAFQELGKIERAAMFGGPPQSS